MLIRRVWIACTGLFPVSFASCGGAVESPVPMQRIYYEASPQLPALRPLLSPGGIVLVPRAEQAAMSVGTMGVAIVRSLTAEEYFAFDLACSVEVSPRSQLQLAGLQLACPRCGSRFDVLTGSGAPTRGEAKYPLRRYRASLTARGTILVTN